jgi:hypothetical protein
MQGVCLGDIHRAARQVVHELEQADKPSRDLVWEGRRVGRDRWQIVVTAELVKRLAGVRASGPAGFARQGGRGYGRNVKPSSNLKQV